MQGKPLSGVTVYETWQNYSVEDESHEAKSLTDDRGFVEFAEQRASSSTLRRLWFTVKAARAFVHASFGVHVYIFAVSPGLEQKGSIDYWSGTPEEVKSQIVMRVPEKPTTLR